MPNYSNSFHLQLYVIEQGAEHTQKTYYYDTITLFQDRSVRGAFNMFKNMYETSNDDIAGNGRP